MYLIFCIIIINKSTINYEETIYPPLTKFKFYLILLAALLFGTINSCKKDNEILPDIKMQEVKAYISNNLNKSESNIFSKLDVDWSNARANELQNEILQEIRLKNPDRIIQTSVITDKPESFENRNDIRLIVFKNKETDKVTNAVYMSVINDSELMDLTKIQYKKSNNLTGKILFYGLDGQFLNGWHYTKGKIDQSITPSTEKAYKANVVKTLQTSPDKLSRIKNENKTALALVMVCSEDMVPSYGMSCIGVEGYMQCAPYFQGYTYVEYCQYENGGGSGDGGGVTNPPTAGGGSSGGPTSPYLNQFILDITTQQNYPKFTTLIKELKTIVQNDAKILDALKLWSGLSTNQILQKLEFGAGPLIVVKDLTGKYGYFSKAENPNVINIDASWVRGLESANLTVTRQGTAFLLGVTVLHEFVHQSRAENNLSRDYEYGTAFENSAFGLEINHDNANNYSYRFYGKSN